MIVRLLPVFQLIPLNKLTRLKILLRLKQSSKRINGLIISMQNDSPAEAEARQYYLELIKNLPHQKLIGDKALFDFLSFEKKNFWWYLDISEKNIWTSKLIHHLYALAQSETVKANNLSNLHFAC